MRMERPYTLSCHCRAVRFQVDADLTGLVECNCSTCGRHGFLHWKVPAAAIRLLTQKCVVSTYKWRDADGGHEFCPACGVALFRAGYPGGVISVNARCIEGLDVFTLPIVRYDGRTKMPPGPYD
ncbi:MAG: Gfa-like protein [Alphaproteobacteria bacterium]|nr:Gfa-like protein [Alphaproteobacteria bacterium]